MFSRNVLRLTSCIAVLLLVGCFAFRDFVFGDKLLLYRDIGSDSLNFYYPYLVLFSRYLRSDGLPLWSFSVGLGQSLFPDLGVLLFNPAAWFPKAQIAHLLVFQHLFLLALAGLFCARFLLLLGLNFRAAVFGALALGFSAFMMMGSCWTICADEAVCLSFALFAVETALRRRVWWMVSLAASLFALLTAFHLYLCALLMTAYALARLFALKDASWRVESLRCLRLGAAALLGVGLTAVVWSDSLIQIFNSSRISSSGSYAARLIASGPFALDSSLHYFTAASRWFSSDLLGVGDHYRGWYNYFEAPLSYCGLASLLLLPQFFVAASRRQRTVAGGFLVLVLIGTVFPWFRYLFYLFQGDYFRAFSLYSIAGVIILSAIAFSRYVKTRTLSLPVLGVTLLCCLALLYFPNAELQKLVDPVLRRTVALLLVSYAAVLLAGRWLKRESIAGWVLLIISAGELASFGRITVSSDRPVLTKHDTAQHIGFNDDTVDALRALNANEPEFFRVTKLYSSSSAEHPNLNDSFVFDYFGTTSYSSFNNANYIRFLRTVGAMPADADEVAQRWSTGLLGHPLALTFACEKYILTQERLPASARRGYDDAGEFEGVQVYRNTFFLPLGLFLPEATSETAFSQLSVDARESVLLQYAVMDDANLREHSPKSSADFARLMNSAETKMIPDLVAQRRATAFRVTSFAQSHIVGEIDCASSGFLVFQTAYDAGWRVSVDGVRAAALRLDGGLLGVAVPPGHHKVSLRYLPPAIWLGGSISLFSALIFVFALRRWPRLPPNESQPRRKVRGSPLAIAPIHPAAGRLR